MKRSRRNEGRAPALIAASWRHTRGAWADSSSANGRRRRKLSSAASLCARQRRNDDDEPTQHICCAVGVAWLLRASAAMAVSVVKGWTNHCHRSIAANVSTHVRSIGAVRRGVFEVCRCVGPGPDNGVGSVERTGWRAHATDASPALRGRYLDTARACRGRGAFTRRVWRERLLVAAVRYGTH